MTTRIGRQGEWANAFTCLCVALGHNARFLDDWTDNNVWTEVFIDQWKRWVHVDSTIGYFDTPFVYEKIWKHKLTYVIATSPSEVVDVTNRYVLNRL